VRAKTALKDALIVRQKFLCCYCESRITQNTSHIEHIEPQFGGISENSLEFSNMAASCIKDPSKPETLSYSDGITVLRDSYLHCGHARGTNRVVSPYDARCGHMFFYSFSGEIRVNENLTDPFEASLAADSIEFLRLNVPSLVEMRKLAMFETVRMLGKSISERDIFKEINGRLPPFISAAQTACAAYEKTFKNSADDAQGSY